MTPEEREALKRVVAYGWPSEFMDYVQCADNGNSREGHIFKDLEVLARYLDRTVSGDAVAG